MIEAELITSQIVKYLRNYCKGVDKVNESKSD